MPAIRSIPENNSPPNRAALKWVREANAPAPGHYLHLLSLAMWGLENGASGEWPDRDRHAIAAQVAVMHAWKPANAMAWLVSNPNGPDHEQQTNLQNEINQAKSPKQAAALVLAAIYSRMQADNSTLQPAQSTSS